MSRERDRCCLQAPAAARRTRASPPALAGELRDRSLAWTGYAAFVWAAGYAVAVRGYQGFGGTVGIAGTFEDPAGMRRASLIAGVGILLVGFGALALVRPWGMRVPRRLLIVPALAGSAYAMAHALTAYMTKPLHALGVVELRFDGWATRDQTAQFLWDLLFYEPWFLGLGVLVSLAALHHHRRSGGTARSGTRLMISTALATLAFTVFSCTLVVARSL